jgi:hypothetical protein
MNNLDASIEVSNSAPFPSYPFPPEVARDVRGIEVFVLPLSGERGLKDNKRALYIFSQYVYPDASIGEFFKLI